MFYSSTQLQASDPDAGPNGEVEFAVLFGSHDAINVFGVDAVTGALSTRRALDSPYVPYYFLSVEVHDTALPPEQPRFVR